MSSEVMGISPQIQGMNHGWSLLPMVGLGMGVQHSSEQRLIREIVLGYYPSRRQLFIRATSFLLECWCADVDGRVEGLKEQC